MYLVSILEVTLHRTKICLVVDSEDLACDPPGPGFNIVVNFKSNKDILCSKSLDTEM